MYSICFEERLIPRDLRKLYAAYDTFLSALKLTRPSDLVAKVDQIRLPRLVYFLRYICIPGVMNSSIAFKSTSEVEADRINVCRVLRKIDARLQTLMAVRSARKEFSSNAFSVSGVKKVILLPPTPTLNPLIGFRGVSCIDTA